ncbi:MAG: hypothetical protein AB2801_09785 [Candidatus Thiodiazotropha endolucinida]
MIHAGELIEDLSACLKLAPYGIPESVINRQIKNLQHSHLNPSSAMTATHSLAALVQDKLRFINQEKVEELLRCEIYVVPLPLCVAYSKPKPKSDSIILGNGLLNLICACGYWAFFVESLPESLDKHYPLEQFPRTSVRDAVPVFLFSLLYRHYCYGEPLPDMSRLIPNKIHEKVRHAIAGAATFILIHELGHLRLGHLDNKNIRSMNVQLVVDEALSTYQLQELEADEYVLNAILPEYRPLHSLWVNMALNFHIQSEILLSHKSSEHPISVNRLSYANEMCEGRLMDPATYTRHLNTMGEKYNDLEEKNRRLKLRNTSPILDHYSRTELLEILEQLNPFLEPEGYGLREALYSDAPDWHTMLKVQ